MKKFLPLYALLIAMLLVSFWTTPGVNAAGPQVVRISEREFSLTPNHVTVTMGQPVQFMVTNNGTIAHNLTVAQASSGMSQMLFAANLNPGETRTATFTFTKAGTWQIFCPVDGHRAAGMVGTITVQASSRGGTVAPTTKATTKKPSTQGGAAAPSTLPTTGTNLFSNALMLVSLIGLVLLTVGLVLWRLLAPSGNK